MQRNTLSLAIAGILLTSNHLAAQDAAVSTPPAGGEITEIVTLGEFIPDEKRATASVANVLDAEAFSRAGDDNVAEGLKRVSGLNLAGGKYVYIRGLGERYSSTILNGSTLPSPEPIRRVVPLDLFPASIIDSVLVQKTYSTQYPAEFAGGTIQMRTKVVPDAPFFEMSSSIGYSGNTTFRDGYTYPGGGTDWLGADDGTRALPPALKDAIAGNRELKRNNLFFKNGFEPEELEAIGESLNNNYSVQKQSVKPDVGASTSFGDVWYGDNFRIGGMANLSYSNSWDSIMVTRNTYVADQNGNLSQRDDLDFTSTEQSVDTSMYLTGGIEIDDAHSLKATLLQIRKTDDLAGIQTGFLATESQDILSTRMEWIENELLSQQIEGEHVFYDLDELMVNWHYNESRASREAPDFRQNRFEFDPATDQYLFSLRADANQRWWSTLEDNNEDIGVSARLFMATPFDTSTELSFGMTRVRKNRESEIRRFLFIANGIDATPLELRSRPSLNDIVTADTISQNGFELREGTRATDNYSADQSLDAWFVEADIELTYYLRLLAGARVEKSLQSVTTFNLFDPDEAITSNLESDDVFPVLTATWILDDYNMQVRAGYSETISRPDFRELSPAPFIDPVTGFIIVGNPSLTVGYIDNYDLRWEWYFSADESLSVGLFYKEFETPIEAIIELGAANQRTFINARDAITQGIEIDTYRWLDFVNRDLANWYVAANLTLIDSEVNIRPQDAGLVTNPTRALQGQADYIFNVQLGFDDNYRHRGSLVYHITGDKIREVGILGQPDVYDEAYGELDLNYTRYIGDHWTLNLRGKNLLNRKRATTQGGLDVNSYFEGRSASLGVEYVF
jgi:TonB-dependent receptor